MADFENESLNVKMTLPDKLSIRQNLMFRSAAATSYGTPFLFERYWAATVPLLENWECKLIPDPTDVNLDDADDPDGVEKTSIIQWAGNTAAGHIGKLGVVPKND